jgi:hypothetical protein
MRSAAVMNTGSAKSANVTVSENTDEDLVLGLPKLKPGQGCSIMALKGYLAGRAPNPPITPEEMGGGGSGRCRRAVHGEL